MKAIQQIRTFILVGTALLAALLMSALPIPASAQTKTHTGKTVAQKLVEATQAKHPEPDEIGISAITSRGCVGIASTDKSDIGEKCEKEDSGAMRTGKPVVEKEKDSFDVTLPLHDSTDDWRIGYRLQTCARPDGSLGNRAGAENRFRNRSANSF